MIMTKDEKARLQDMFQNSNYSARKVADLTGVNYSTVKNLVRKTRRYKEKKLIRTQIKKEIRAKQEQRTNAQNGPSQMKLQLTEHHLSHDQIN
jgi:transposase